MGKDIVTVKLTLGLPSQFMPVPAMGLNYGGANHFCLGKLVLVVVFCSRFAVRIYGVIQTYCFCGTRKRLFIPLDILYT